ncbi:MAG: cyclic nucleotide-binding domain-containing protein [Verrucomicrobiae bacterium]
MNAFAPLADPESLRGILSKISILGGVSDSQRKKIVGRLEIASFSKGAAVFEKGSEPTHIYIVKSGRLELLVTGDDHAVVKRKVLDVGESFGEASLLSMQRHSADVVALERSEVLAFSKHSLIALQHEDIPLFALLMMNIARDLARRLKFTDDVLLHYIHSSRHDGGPARSDE